MVSLGWLSGFVIGFVHLVLTEITVVCYWLGVWWSFACFFLAFGLVSYDLATGGYIGVVGLLV